MAYEFFLPDIGEGLTEATVVRWLVDVGSVLGVDEPMVEVETDKAVVEIPAPRAGVVLHLGASPGATVPVDSLLVVIGDEGEEWQPGRPDLERGTDTAAPIVGTLDEGDGAAPVMGDLGVSTRIEPGPGVQALPLVRRLASTLGVDLGLVRGTGPGGRVTRGDVEAAAASAAAGERVRMSPTRLAIARNLTRSWREIPHVTTYGEAAAEALLERRRALGAESGTAVPLEALLMQIVVPLLERHRAFNAFVDGEDVVFRSDIDLGFAVDTPNGLMVAVVRAVPARTLEGIATEIARLAEAARSRSITASEMRGASFTISNIGAVGGRFGTPIIPYGTSAILSVGRADARPVVRQGAVVVGREFPLSLSYDHRIIDGAAGRAFMADLIEGIEAGGS